MGRKDRLAYALFAFAIVLLPVPKECNSVALSDTLSLGTSLTEHESIVSSSGKFELGFFHSGVTNNFYIAIWSVQSKTVVWVANRETPVRNVTGVLRLSSYGVLGLFDQKNASVWSVNASKAASKAVIYDSGNFVLLGGSNKSETLWQSFDHPGNIWLPGMKFGRDQKLVSWKNSLDPAPGIFSLRMDPSGNNQFVLLSNNTMEHWRIKWDSIGASESSLFGNVRFNVENTSSGLYLTYIFTVEYLSLGFSLRPYGVFGVEYYFDQYKVDMDEPFACDVHGLCGPYGICRGGDDPCICAEGWSPRDPHAWSLHDWSSGCVSQSTLNCDPQIRSTDSFINPDYIWVPAKANYSYPEMGRDACEKVCLRNCSCVAYYSNAYDPDDHLCEIWSSSTGDLSDTLVRGYMLTIRLGDGRPRSIVWAMEGPAPSSSPHYKAATVVVPLLSMLLVIALVFTIVAWRRRRSRSSTQSSPDTSDALLLRTFSYEELKAATRNFRFKLGARGFGSVFKGTLTDGTLVAVKKLEGSKQCEKQFRAEINSVGIINHKNLVRLKGFCAQGSRRLLVYEYMANGSLNSFLYANNSKRQPKTLDWRTRSEIALGTARGLLYLHEQCRDRIIHSDIKPENILLDENFIPKLGDFGLAKLVGRDFSEVLTTTRGTRGYLAPEWVSGLPITSKVDVYSYGMTLLEIMSGRRNLDFTVKESSRYYLPAWAEEQICQRNMINIVDKRIASDANVEEVRRAALVSLLCIQNEENARPNMAQVVLMLEGKTEAPTPQISAVMVNRRVDGQNSGSDSESDCIV